MSHYIANVRDLEFNLFEVLPLAAALDEGGYGDLDTDAARSMLDEVGRFAESVIAEPFVEADRNPPVF
ncbi:acyl-CoA dehydrogenase family protein, partial [Mycolicibacterium sp. CBMA 361]|nr:acyl-CoA dehydrogenase [Mycolicibacterium sp. CBMA 361]